LQRRMTVITIREAVTALSAVGPSETTIMEWAAPTCGAAFPRRI
jgi:hypothetical protein